VRNCNVCYDAMGSAWDYDFRVCTECGDWLQKLFDSNVDTLPALVAKRNIGNRRLRGELNHHDPKNRRPADGKDETGTFRRIRLDDNESQPDG